MDHRKTRRMDRIRLASPTWTNHLPHGNGSLPNPRIPSRKCVDALVRSQGRLRKRRRAFDLITHFRETREPHVADPRLNGVGFKNTARAFPTTRNQTVAT